MPRIKMTEVIKTLEGDPVQDVTLCVKCRAEAKPQKPATLRTICINAMMSPPENGKPPMTGEEKLSLFYLCGKIQKFDECSLTVDDLKKIKDRVGDFPQYGPLIVGRAWELLDPPDKQEKHHQAQGKPN